MNEQALEKGLQDIGQAIADEIGGNPDGAFLYAIAKPGMMMQSLFLDRGDYVECFMVSEALSDALFGVWYAAEPGKEWAVLSYVITGNSFDAGFEFPNEIPEDEWPEDRRDRVLRERYGDKPIKYPPPPDG